NKSSKNFDIDAFSTVKSRTKSFLTSKDK
ncbi:hypothetical protein JOC61_001097, partial [Marinitoga litoralis]|nr:hypothetical protein [Marinitoga litoralis]